MANTRVRRVSVCLSVPCGEAAQRQRQGCGRGVDEQQ